MMVKLEIDHRLARISSRNLRENQIMLNDLIELGFKKSSACRVSSYMQWSKNYRKKCWDLFASFTVKKSMGNLRETVKKEFDSEQEVIDFILDLKYFSHIKKAIRR